MNFRIPEADSPFEIVWDKLGIPHVYAKTIEDAYRGMGYAAGYERLWQIHLSCAYANGEASALLGERFLTQDSLQKAFNVPGKLDELPSSEGDYIAEAYLQGLNAYVRSLGDIPPEFKHADALPREFTMLDIAARYRFTSWFQHKSWTEKLVLGRLMATHGVDKFSDHVLHFSDEDINLIEQLKEPLKHLDPKIIELAYPNIKVPSFSGSNNWAVTGANTISGKPILATDPHQPFTIPSTFFYIHLHVDSWDAFGTAFPGVPYFMMGYTKDIAWGLTTGFVDCYDLFIEKIEGDKYKSQSGSKKISVRKEIIEIKDQSNREIEIKGTHHGVLLEPLLQELGISRLTDSAYQTSLYWSLQDIPTSGGALSRLPLAKSAEEFKSFLFENDVCPLVNNIICVDKESNLQRYIATTMPNRKKTTGSVPLIGWLDKYDFELARADQLLVENNPKEGFSLTANNDTMGEEGEFYIHNFPTHDSRADRIREFLVENKKFDMSDFCEMQLDLKDLRAKSILPDLIKVLASSTNEDVKLAVKILNAWNCDATIDSAGPCIFYPFLDRFWPRKFMYKVLADDLINILPLGAPGLNRFDISTFLKNKFWRTYESSLLSTIEEEMAIVVKRVKKSLGDDSSKWRWGDLHKIQFKHSLNKFDYWKELHLGPDEIGGSPTTLGMAMHMGKGPGKTEDDEIPCRVYHGPAYRLVVDLNDPEHAKFVIAGGNGGRADSKFCLNHFATWLKGDYFTLNFNREEINESFIWQFKN